MVERGIYLNIKEQIHQVCSLDAWKWCLVTKGTIGHSLGVPIYKKSQVDRSDTKEGLWE